MKKNDIIVIVALGLLFIAWPTIDRQIISKFFPARPVPATEEPANDEPAVAHAPDGENVPAIPLSVEGSETPAEPKKIVRSDVEESAIIAPAQNDETPDENLPDPTLLVMQNKVLKLTLTSRGGAIANATIINYKQSRADDSPSIEFPFTDSPSLAYEGVPGFGAVNDFKVVEKSEKAVVFEKELPGGLKLRRAYGLSDGYLLTLNDSWSVSGSDAISIDSARVLLGEMTSLPGLTSVRGMQFLGIDSLTGSDGVKYWGKRPKKLFELERSEKNLSAMPLFISRDPWSGMQSIDWMAVKNKYFVQILTPVAEVENGEIRMGRKLTKTELSTSKVKDGVVELERVSAAIAMKSRVVKPDEPVDWGYSYYIGPKKLSALKNLADHKVDVMQLGWLGGIGKLLLTMLNAIHLVIPNYGLAIIILTFIIKLLFWPITHKGMKGMRRMQDIQPAMNAVKEKYKDDKQKQQEEMAKLWKENNVNPVSGCLPMIVQIPVFISLFTVLRSAIELRFQGFLWIHDLSEPEHLFNLGFTLPVLGEYFNLLPILMAVTMALQQKMTPSSGDPQQQKMMAVFMPIMIFAMLYNFPSGLILYWTTNQTATIIGQAVSLRKHKNETVKA